MPELIDLINAHRAAVSTKAREETLVALFDFLNPDLYLFFLRKVPDQDAQDLRSTTLLDIHKGLKNFKGDNSQVAWEWCYTIARRKLAAHFEKKGTSVTKAVDPELLEELASASLQTKPFENAAEKIDVQEALAILNKSDPDCFEVLWERFISGLGYRELGSKIGKTADAARMQISRCIEIIKPLLG